MDGVQILRSNFEILWYQEYLIPSQRNIDEMDKLQRNVPYGMNEIFQRLYSEMSRNVRCRDCVYVNRKVA